MGQQRSGEQQPTDIDDIDDIDPWLGYADAALHHLIALQREARGVAGDDSPPSTWTGPAHHEAQTRFHRSLTDPGNGFATLAINARLSITACEVLALVVAVEIDARRQALIAHLQDDPRRRRLTIHTLGVVLGGIEQCATAIGADSRLRRAELVSVTDDGPWAQLTVAPPPALVWAFAGDTSPDVDLPMGARLEIPPSPPGGGSTRAHNPGSVDRVVFAYGADRVRRRRSAIAALPSAERFLVSPQPDDDRGWAALVREATMTGAAVVLEVDNQLSPRGRHWIERADHLAWAVTATNELPIDQLPDCPFVELECATGELDAQEWTDAFGDIPRHHRLTPQQAEQVRKVSSAGDNDIDAAVRRLLAGPLDSLARRIRPRSTWDDLVLSPGRMGELRSIVARYRHASHVYDEWGFTATPSRGLVSLFAGASGTGKTLAAEVVAGELGLDMFKLDLSAVVSKYIGETEKNLDQVFEAAGVGNVVLFFDEADALFGKRSEVRDSRDRYANLEVSYLLQRIESFDGVVVLATNFAKNIDEAFLRRIHTRIDFSMPAVAERLAIWELHLPPVSRGDDVDLGWLARQFEFTGGQIRNAAIDAAFQAAAAGTSITMVELARGAAHEVRKSGRLLQAEVFGPWFETVDD